LSTAIAAYHGVFGRACLYSMNRPMTTHAHREGHLCFHVDGVAAANTIDGVARPIAPDQAVGLNPWELHDFIPGSPDESGVYLVLYIRPDWFETVGGRQAFGRFGRPEIDVNGYLRRRVERTVSLLLDGGPRQRLDDLLFELTGEAFSQARCGAGEEACRFGRLNDFRIRKAIRLIGERLEYGVELDRIARDAGLSRPHFFKLFRLQTGLTPNLFLNTLRMERAIDYLIGTSRPVTEIGFDLGFSSQSSFTRFFASNVGMAPTDYRRVARLI
jgi:AraC-like DNA-binding protein